jgi:heat shock protein HslJ
VAGEARTLPAQRHITLRFVDSRVVTGHAPVNVYFGGLTLADDGVIHWQRPGFATTLMAGPEDLMLFERDFFSALASTSHLKIEPDTLIFETAGGGAVRLVFEALRQETALSAMIGKPQQLTRLIVDGREAPIHPDMKVVLVFTAPGRVAGFSGVNRYIGTFSASGATIDFGAIAATRMAGPEHVMKLEGDYMRALDAVTAFRVSGNSLVLENGDKSVIIEFEPATQN